MKVADVFVQNRRLWVRLREKGGKRCTIGRTTSQLTTTPLPQANAHAMIRRRAWAAPP
jgi:hypothetical protein